MLRHTLATLAYRAQRALHPAPAGFSEFRASANSRSAGEILAHLSDLLEWAVRVLSGDRSWVAVPPATWEADKDRFFGALTRLDQALREPVSEEIAQRLLQGPIADALTHVGQVTLMRGMAGAAVKNENYFMADIAIGRTTPIQPSPKRTF